MEFTSLHRSEVDGGREKVHSEQLGERKKSRRKQSTWVATSLHGDNDGLAHLHWP